ncbi:O-antigen ligase family protein [Haladaptatus sp. DJG-WS-42]|uniref:O-antigen ligase family protein n=1 Tax=Haladaptatus sp. DJG-WS-42 TaxID=3120516 RepID=UPI0030D4D69A
MVFQETLESRKANPNIVSLLAALLFCSLILQNTQLSTAPAYAIIALTYVCISIAFLWYTPQITIARNWLTPIFVAFVVIVFVRTALDPALSNVVRFFVLLTFTTANLFILPQLISFRKFCNVGSRISAVLVVIGFLPYLGFSFTIGFIDVSLWGSSIYWYPDLKPMMSVFINPNQLGGLTLFATIASIREWTGDGTSIALPLIALNFIGLALSNYRTGWVAFGAAVAIFIVYLLWGRRALLLATIGGLSGLMIALFMMFGVIPGPEFLTEISLNGRRALWIDSVTALRGRLLLGHGFQGVISIVGNPHNSYLRMFTAFGLIGGFLYLVFVIGATVDGARRATTTSGVVLAMLLVAFAVVQVNNQLSFVGISMRSTIIAIILGYSITTDFKTDFPQFKMDL